MIRLLGAVIFAPVTGMVGGLSAITNALTNAYGGKRETNHGDSPAPRSAPLYVMPSRMSAPIVTNGTAMPGAPEVPQAYEVPASAGQASAPGNERSTGRWSDLQLPPAPILPPQQGASASHPAESSTTIDTSPPHEQASTWTCHENRNDDEETSPARGEHKAMDQDLNDDMNKLVRYSIVCVDRENETVLQGIRETLVKDRMDHSGFTAWKIMEFVRRMVNSQVNVPDDWMTDPPEGATIHHDKLMGFEGDVMKYLRVPFQVVERYPRERYKYEEKQNKILKNIELAIKGGCAPNFSGLKPGERLEIEIK